jgi:hypothetical protein
MVLFGAWSRLVGSDSESASAAQQAIADSQSAAASDTPDWVAVDGGELRFAATLPVVPDRTDTVSPSASGDVTLTMFTATPNPSTTVAVGAYTVQPGATFDLDQAAVGVVEKIGGTTIDRVEGRDAAGNRYVELTLKVAQGDVVVRLLDAGHHSYILESLGADAAQNFQRLLAGFALT